LGLSDTQIEVLAGSINVFMLVSALAAGWAADQLGRRGTLVLANSFFTAGALAMSLGDSYAALVFARFVTGVGSGFSLVVTSVYNAEISPASMRGFLSSFPNVGSHLYIYCTLHRLFQYKVFNEAIPALCMLYHLIFPHRGFLGDDILRAYTLLSWCFLLYFPIGFLRSFILIYQCTSKFFPQGFSRLNIMMNIEDQEDN
jgi:MFS family permease